MQLCEFIANIEAHALASDLLNAEVISVGTGMEHKENTVRTAHFWLVKVKKGDEERTIKIYYN